MAYLTNAMKTSFNKEHVMLLGMEDVAISTGVASVEDMQQARKDYNAFIYELAQEWPPERLKEYVLQQLRDKYASAAKYLQKLEVDNRDARARGVSYKEREKTFTAKIRGGHEYIRELKKRGQEAKTWDYTLSGWVGPMDAAYVQEHGLEKHLKYAVL